MSQSSVEAVQAPVLSGTGSTAVFTPPLVTSAPQTARQSPDGDDESVDAPVALSRGRAAARGRSRGTRGGRGRGKVSGTSKKAISKSTKSNKKSRGRVKQFDNPKVQAAYERTRELKDQYQILVAALRPALADLAQRNVDMLMADPHAHEIGGAHKEVLDDLNQRYAKCIDRATIERDAKIIALEQAMAHQEFILHEQYRNGVEDVDEVFLDAQERRLDILETLHKLKLSPDTEDIDHVFKAISAKEYAEFGPFEDYDEEGHHVPYPSRVKGTFMYQFAQELAARNKAEKAAAAAEQARAAEQAVNEGNHSKNGRGSRGGRGTGRGRNRGGRGVQHTSTLATNSQEEDEDSVPAHPMGILAGTDVPALGEDLEDEDAEVARQLDDAASSTSSLPIREQSPELPRGAESFDTHGAATVQARGKGHGRIILKPMPVPFDDLDIGFRDSSNDPDRLSNVLANRRKYASTPHSGTIHVDPMTWNYDARQNEEGDLDRELVERHKLHPKFGFFLRISKNDAIIPDRPVGVQFGEPIVFLPENEDIIVSSCRSTIARTTERMQDSRRGRQLTEVLKVVYNSADIDPDELGPDSDEQIPPSFRGKPLGVHIRPAERTATRRFLNKEALRLKELERLREEAVAKAQAIQDQALAEQEEATQSENMADIDPSVLSILIEALQALPTPPLQPETTEETTETRTYDAIRDVFLSGPRDSSPAVALPAVPEALLTLADAALARPEPINWPARGPSGPPLPPLQQVIDPAPLPPAQPAHLGYDRAPSVDAASGYSSMPNMPSVSYYDQPPRDYYPSVPPVRYPSHEYQPMPVMGQSSPLPPLRPVDSVSPRREAENGHGPYYPPLSMSIITSSYYPTDPAMGPNPPMPPIGSVPPSSGPGYYQPPRMGSYGSPAPTVPYDPMMNSQMASSVSPRERTDSVSSMATVSGPASNSAKYRKLEPAPVPKHRRGWANEPQLRTVGYDPSNDIKDYAAVEPLPGRAPSFIRAWSHNNSSQTRRRSSKRDGERRDAE